MLEAKPEKDKLPYLDFQQKTKEIPIHFCLGKGKDRSQNWIIPSRFLP